MRVKLRRKSYVRAGKPQLSYELTLPKAIIESLFTGIEYFELRVETREGKPVLLLEPVE